MKKNVSMKFLVLLAVCLSFLAVFPLKTSAGEPTDQIKQTVDDVIAILNNKELKKPEKEQERKVKIRATIEKSFDFAEMAKRSLGIYWKERNPNEQKEFVALFSSLLEDTYIRKIERYEDEKVAYVGEIQEGSYATVKTRIITTRGSEIPVEYKIFKKENKWEVYDIIIEGVSLVNNYRSQFSQIISSSSYEELIKRLKEKSLKSSK
ncbi:MAG TPA: organic solvent tolerance ABC transporter substrate-binding protein [Nitrospiraceae bacterium]|jgi:phospholipid transport system substrate-binding protein|nr:organic solvent tolerance ABC transporter substrate-binding protein [Nitrospiraceae bacterium]